MRTGLSFLFLIVSSLAFAGTIPFVSDEMRTPDHWIARQPSPDAVVMTMEEIAAFDHGLHAQKITEDLDAFPSVYSAARLKDEIAAMASQLKGRKLFQQDGTEVGLDVLAAFDLAGGVDVSRGELPVRFGVTVTFADERVLPTDDPFYEKPGDVEFDQVQNSGLDPATPLVILYQTMDGGWLWVHDGIASGWVRTESVAFMSGDEWRTVAAPKDLVVVTAARTAVMGGPGSGETLGIMRMGSRLAFKGAEGSWVEVVYPERKDNGDARLTRGYVKADDISSGYLPYTASTVIRQAFKLLDTPYGWGDREGYPDCSRLMQMVFATVGIHLPRNSGEQAQAGIPLDGFDPSQAMADKARVLTDKAVGGLTLLRLKGHIMLYLGAVDGRLYAIHATSGYRWMDDGQEKSEALKRVVVSDLSLGQGTSKGSLLERVVAAKYLGGKI